MRRGRRRQQLRRRRVFAFLALILLALGAIVGLRWVISVIRDPSSLVSRPAVPRVQHLDAINSSARRNHLDAALVAAVIAVESGFDPTARSLSGALGLMQLMPETAKHLAAVSGGTAFKVSDLMDPAINIRYGCACLRLMLRHYHGSEIPALAAYNAGMGSVDGWAKRAGVQGRRLKSEHIPYSETRAYVDRVVRFREEYRRIYGDRLYREK